MPITEEELESLEAEANSRIDLKEFIPLASVDPVYFENNHYPGADKGGEKPYRLLADAMAKSGRVAIAEIVSRGKEQLVLICPYKKGLVLHTMYHADEVRDFKQVPKGEKVNVSTQELELGDFLLIFRTVKAAATNPSPINMNDEGSGTETLLMEPMSGPLLAKLNPAKLLSKLVGNTDGNERTVDNAEGPLKKSESAEGEILGPEMLVLKTLNASWFVPARSISVTNALAPVHVLLPTDTDNVPALEYPPTVFKKTKAGSVSVS